MLIIILLIVIALYCHDFKKGILLIAPFKFFLLPSLTIESFQFNAVLTLVTLVFYIVKSSQKKEKKDAFPLIFSFVLMMLSQIYGSFAGGIHLKALFNYTFSTFLFVYMLFNCINKKEDVDLLLKSTVVFLCITMGNAAIEFVTSQRVNILSDFMTQNSPDSVFFSADDNADGRGTRIRSQYSHGIVFGDICAIFIYLCLFLYTKIKARTHYIIMIVCLVIGLMLSLSRTPMLGLLIFIIPIILNKGLFTRRDIIIIIACIIGYYYSSDYIYSIFDSLLNANTQTEFGGSSIDLRMQQLEGCFIVIAKNPLFGLGIDFNLEDWSWVLMGNESTWFELLCRQGIVGCVINLLIYIQIIYTSRKNPYFTNILFLASGWLMICTASNLSNMDSYPFFLVYLIMYKYGMFYNQNSKKITT